MKNTSYFSKALFEKGYNNTSIQAIIDVVDIAKGTFYHHFKSKHELLEELTDMLVAKEVEDTKAYVLSSKEDAITKMNTIHHKHIQWKSENMDMMMVVFQAMYADANSPFRVMMQEKSVHQNLFIYNTLIQQGIEEGVFNTPFPDDIGKMILKLSHDSADELARILLNHATIDNPYEKACQAVKLMFHTIERLLGAEPNKIEIIDLNILKQFFDYLEKTPIRVQIIKEAHYDSC